MKNFAVYGAGAWGTALAITLCRSNAFLIPRRQDHGEEMERSRENPIYLPGVKFPDTLKIINDFEKLPKLEALLLAIPTQKLRYSLMEIAHHFSPDLPLIICAKGIEFGSQSLLTEVVGSIVPNPLLVLSGPNFAMEVACNLPSASTLASKDLPLALELSKVMRNPNFRIYASDDPVGVQIAGAVKNVLAIASGIVHGKKLGRNAASALISRGLHEMKRLGMAMGAQAETFLSLAAIGDLVLTCSAPTSRNMSLGIEIGEGKKLSGILQQRHTIAEGVDTSKSVAKLSVNLNVCMPICQAVYQVLYEDRPVNQAIRDILLTQSDRE